MTFSKRQKVHLLEGGEFSCDAVDTSSSQEFQQLSAMKNPSSHPLQQVQNGREYCNRKSPASNSENMGAKLLTPDTNNKPREPPENARKGKPSFKKTDKARDPAKMKNWHNQLFANQDNDSQEDFQEMGSKLSRQRIQNKNKKTERSKTRKNLGRETPASTRDDNEKYEDDIQLQGYDSDIELSPVHQLRTALSGIVPLSPSTSSDISSPLVSHTPRQKALPMQKTGRHGSQQGTTPAGDKSKATLSAALTSKLAPGTEPPRRRRVTKLYNPEPLMSFANSQVIGKNLKGLDKWC